MAFKTVKSPKSSDAISRRAFVQESFYLVFCMTVSAWTLSFRYAHKKHSSKWSVFSPLLLWFLHLSSHFVFHVIIENRWCQMNQKYLTTAVFSLLDCTISLVALSRDFSFLCNTIMLIIHSENNSMVSNSQSNSIIAVLLTLKI